jgi:hypothetical protein
MLDGRGSRPSAVDIGIKMRRTPPHKKESPIRFLLILGLVKVLESLVHLLYSAKWPLDLTLRAGCDASAILALWQMSAHIDVQVHLNRGLISP